MENHEINYFKRKDDFYERLNSNYRIYKETWIWYYKKDSWLESITWSESVDVALCFGWIDGIRKKIDDKSYKIRFTPRKIDSLWSKVNVEKVEKLILSWEIKEEGLELFKKRKDKEWYSSQNRNINLSNYFVNEFKKSTIARNFFSNLAPSYKRDSIWWVMSAKKEETRKKRFNILLNSSHEELKIPILRKKQ
jgi:uncharacterized protein YdeI (YjbR/CyaY-like superfamily)